MSTEVHTYPPMAGRCFTSVKGFDSPSHYASYAIDCMADISSMHDSEEMADYVAAYAELIKAALAWDHVKRDAGFVIHEFVTQEDDATQITVVCRHRDTNYTIGMLTIHDYPG